MNKIYLVVQGCYSDWDIVGYFTSRDDAERFCIKEQNKYNEPCVMTVDCLDGDIDLSDVKTLYEHDVFFDKTNNGWQMRNEPDRYKVYDSNEENIRANKIEPSPYYRVISSPYTSWIRITVNQDKFDRKKAEKIAQDILYRYLNFATDPFNSPDIVKIINEALSAPQRAREEAKAAEELKQKELSELARLKEKYENN